jgi:formate dehydrogenase iron-sulfur subunit
MSESKTGRPTDDPGRDAAGNADEPASAPLTRRKFLSISMLAGGLALTAPVRAHATQPEFEGWPDGYGMLTDFTACVGCRSCEKACNEVNKLPAPDKPFTDASVFSENRWPTAKAYTVVNKYPNSKDSSKPLYRKIQCNHCLEPACATACPIHAYTKTPEGAVIYNEDLCFGCRYCVVACPFNIPAYDYESAREPKIMKCILCYSRIKEGKLPGCAEACPGGAITFGKRAELLKLARKRITDNPGKYVDHIFGEREVGGTSWLYLSAVPFEELGFPNNLPKKSPIELSKGYLSSIPVIFTTFPALFGLLYAATHHNDKEGGKEEGADNHKKEAK